MNVLSEAATENERERVKDSRVERERERVFAEKLKRNESEQDKERWNEVAENPMGN